MNIKEYISSGILESYVLGQCSVDQQREVEVYALQYKEVQEELNSIREALGNYVLLEEKTPPAHLKNKIAAAIKQSGSTSLTVTDEPKKEAKVIKMEAAKETAAGIGSGFYKLLAAASIALLIACGYMLYDNNKKLESADKKMAGLKEELDNMHKGQLLNDSLFAIEKRQLEFKLAQQDIVKKPSMVAMPMTGKENAPDAKVVVYGDTKTNEIFLEVNKLPKAPTGMQYQLWAIIKGKPVSAGVIQICEQPDTCGILKMSSLADAHAFAISLEKTGGEESPKGNIYATFGL